MRLLVLALLALGSGIALADNILGFDADGSRAQRELEAGLDARMSSTGSTSPRPISSAQTRLTITCAK